MGKEIELKLRVSPHEARRLDAHALLAGCATQTYSLFNTYYDTPELELRQRGVALRLRRKGDTVWLMTVKGGDAGAGGLAQRSEWEASTEPGIFDFAIVGDVALRKFLESRKHRLQALFSTDFTRTTWTVGIDDARVEVALDRGTIRAAAANARLSTEPLCELELELVAGASPDPLFTLAIELAGKIALHPEIRSKAERGYALAQGDVASPVKSRNPPINTEMAPVEAFRAVALSCLVHLQCNEGGAIAGNDSEYLHQTRIAIRRLRSALKLFAPVLSDEFVAIYAPRWRALACRLGNARDWDVFVHQTLAACMEVFPADVAVARVRERAQALHRTAQTAVAAALREKAYSELLLAFSAALFRQSGPTIARQAGQHVSLRRLARRAMEERVEAITKLLGATERLDAERRHALRIKLKTLRYGMEFFAPLYASHSVRRYQDALSALQDVLGALNDQLTAARLIRETSAPGRPDRLAEGWRAGQSALLQTTLEARLQRFSACPQPRQRALRAAERQPVA